MSVASIDLERRELCHAGVGNIGVVIRRVDHEQRLPSTSAVLGSRGVQRVRDEVVAFTPGSVLVMHSDGLSSRLGFAHDPQLKRKPPVVIAQELLDRFGQSDDDGLVLVVRFG